MTEACIPEAFFARDTLTVARDLVGATLAYDGCAGVIVETEAYTDDAASHYVIRKPSAGALMGTTHGRVYVYRIYGMHLCLNFTTDARGPGAVLVRALEPTAGIDRMRARRGRERLEDLCSGPSKLAQALGVEIDLNERPVRATFALTPRTGLVEVATAPRVGIRVATELEWRFYAAASRFVSRRPRGQVVTTRSTQSE